MSWEDDEPENWTPDFKLLRPEKERTARRHHTCETCEGAIEPGQRYKSFVALDEGKFTVTKWHSDRDECAAAAEKAKLDQQAYWEGYNRSMAEHWDEECKRRDKECDWCGRPVEPPGLCDTCSQEHQDHYGKPYQRRPQ